MTNKPNKIRYLGKYNGTPGMYMFSHPDVEDYYCVIGGSWQNAHKDARRAIEATIRSTQPFYPSDTDEA